MVDKTEKSDLKSMAIRCGRSLKSLQRSVAKNYRGSAMITIPGIGRYAILKPGRNYELVKVSGGYSEKEVERRFLDLLNLLRKHVCRDCAKIIKEVADAG